MILIDALYINNGGGKVLLDYLIIHLEQTDLEIYYLFDDRVSYYRNIKSKNKTEYIKSTLSNRYFFYKKSKSLFSKVLVLGNIPPPIPMRGAIIYTYFHNAIYLKVPSEFSFIEKVKYFLKIVILKRLAKNTNHWLVQSENVKVELFDKYNFDSISVIPFFELPKISDDLKLVKKEKGSYIYVSNAQANKNHLKLIDAFCQSYDLLKTGKLYLTVSADFPSVLNKILIAKSNGYPIVNLGFIKKEVLANYYAKSEYIIFPSLSESFGLGIIEGIAFGCKLIGSKLNYTYAVCNPSLVFNPNEVASISEAISFSLKNEIRPSEILVENQIDKLIELLSENVQS